MSRHGAMLAGAIGGIFITLCGSGCASPTADAGQPPSHPAANAHLTPADAQRISDNSVHEVVDKYRKGFELTFIADTTRVHDLPAWKMAAAAHQPAGELMCGLCTYYGLGEPANAEQGKTLLLAAANAGHAEAMAVLSIILRNGTIASRPDVDQANKWLDLAVQKHSVVATDEVAIAAAKELLIDGKVSEAMDAYFAGARAGNLRAQVSLAGIRRRAWLSQENIPASIQMLEAAAAQGHIGAMIDLGNLYSTGRYVTPDLAKTKQWFDAAAATGDPRALFAAARAYETGRLTADKHIDLPSAKHLWDTLAASSDPYAAFELYRAQLAARTLDDATIRKYLFDAGTRGVPEAYTFVATCYREGALNTTKDVDTCIRYLDDGVAAGDPSAVFQRACAYRFGYVGNPDEDQARPLFFAAARMGVPRAMTSVALRYMTGRGVKLDPLLGHLCYLAAAREGDAEAMTSVANDYETGRGVKADLILAKRWAVAAVQANQLDAYETLFHIAGGREAVAKRKPLPSEALAILEQGTQAGSLACARDLGDLLIRGGAVKQDVNRGLAMLEKAAATDAFGETQCLLGDHYSESGACGLKPDPQRAIQYYEAAVKCGNSDAWSRLGMLHAMGSGFEKDPALAMEEYEKGLALGSSACAYQIGRAYFYGDGVTKDAERGVKMLHVAADGGCAQAPALLAEANLITNGLPVDEAEGFAWVDKGVALGDPRAAWIAAKYYNRLPDYSKAFAWYLRAADMGDLGSMNDLGVLYRFGRGVPQNFTLAAQYYKRAAEAGVVEAMGNYSWCLENGNGVPVDKPEAFRWALKVAMAGDRAGMYHVGRMYFDGIGVKRDQQTGLDWLKKSAAAGEPDAMKIIAMLKDKGVLH